MSNAFEQWTWVFAWIRERVLTGWWWLVPLSIVISMAGGTSNWFVRAWIALFALVVFRLWDDLEDLQHDRVWHSERVLCRTNCGPRAYVLCAAGLLIASLLIAAVGGSWIAFVAVLPLVFVASRLRRKNRSSMRVGWAHVILLKIPVLVVALVPGGMSQSIAWERAVGLYGFVGVYEVLHDAEARRSSWAPLVFLMAIGCLVWGLTTEVLREAGI